MSRMLPVCPLIGTIASVVEAVLLERIESLGEGGGVAPRPTESVVVERVTWPALLVVQPPAEEIPAVEIVPQDTLPELSVCSAWVPVQVAILESVKAPETRPVPKTSSVLAGVVVPMPTLP